MIFSLIKGRHVGHLQWDLMIKALTAEENLYGAGSLGMRDTIYSRDGSILMDTACPTRVPWFVKFVRGSKLRMGVINNK